MEIINEEKIEKYQATVYLNEYEIEELIKNHVKSNLMQIKGFEEKKIKIQYEMGNKKSSELIDYDVQSVLGIRIKIIYEKVSKSK